MIKYQAMGNVYVYLLKPINDREVIDTLQLQIEGYQQVHLAI